jgi:PAS domain S-box-containing protein
VNGTTFDYPAMPGSSGAEHLDLLLRMSSIGIWELDVPSGAAWRNEMHDRIFGYDGLLPEWSYERFLDHVLPEDRASVEERYGGSLRAGQPWSFECRIRRADGEVRWITATGRPIVAGDGSTLKLIGHVMDVTHLKRNEERLRVLLDELNHRVRNTLTIVQALAARSFQDHVGVAQARKDFTARINALAAAHTLLTDRDWTEATLGDLVDRVLLPFRQSGDPRESIRIGGSGPAISVSPRHAVSLSMALNELATNAMKHGSLAVPGGRVDLTWTARPVPAEEGASPAAPCTRVEILWRERDGPPVAHGGRTGFGLTLLERLVPGDLDGRVDVAFDPEGVTCRIDFEVSPWSAEAPPGTGTCPDRG